MRRCELIRDFDWYWRGWKRPARLGLDATRWRRLSGQSIISPLNYESLAKNQSATASIALKKPRKEHPFGWFSQVDEPHQVKPRSKPMSSQGKPKIKLALIDGWWLTNGLTFAWCNRRRIIWNRHAGGCLSYSRFHDWTLSRVNLHSPSLPSRS